ncbi:MAG: substrate-binding domain-containing protein [Acidobacteria bacterium]|nr:substrate-binding domain-containing protein [Acidobacteriota bacterium]
MKQSRRSESPPYAVDAVLKALEVLEAFRGPDEVLPLAEMARRAFLPKPTVFRLARTLAARGYLARAGDGYRCLIRTPRRSRYRIGFAKQSDEFAFSRAVCESIYQATRERDVDLLTLDNRYSPRFALRNVERFIQERVDLAIEFQTDESVAPVISSRFVDAGIPFIAVEIPHPGATYYGANNYRAGLIGGRHLGQWARQHWNGEVDEVLLLELSMAGPVPRSRMTGTLAGIQEVLPGTQLRAHFLDGNGQYAVSLEAARKYLKTTSAKRILVGAMNDPSAIGALRAFEEAGRASSCAVVGQNAAVEGRAELRRPNTRFIASVAYFPERYGNAIISLAIDILQGRPVPPAMFAGNKLLTAANVDQYYPDDAFLSVAESEELMLCSR